MFKRLLVPLDGSRFGSLALKYAIEVAHHFDAEVILMQVVKPVIPMIASSDIAAGMQSPATAKVEAQAALEEDKRNVAHARRYLSGKVRGIRSQSIEGSYHVVVGDPFQSIMMFAQKEHVDLVVMTTHGKSGLKRAIMGSVADAVIRESGKPVLVVRPGSHSKK